MGNKEEAKQKEEKKQRPLFIVSSCCSESCVGGRPVDEI